MSDWRTELERVRGAFAKGLGAVEVLIERAVDDIGAVGRKVDANNDRLTKLENELPSELREKITRFDLYIVQLEEAKKEHTGKIRIIEDEALKDETKVKREEIQTTAGTEKRKANLGVVIAIIAATGSLLVQVAQMIWSAVSGG